MVDYLAMCLEDFLAISVEEFLASNGISRGAFAPKNLTFFVKIKITLA